MSLIMGFLVMLLIQSNSHEMPSNVNGFLGELPNYMSGGIEKTIKVNEHYTLIYFRDHEDGFEPVIDATSFNWLYESEIYEVYDYLTMYEVN